MSYKILFSTDEENQKASCFHQILAIFKCSNCTNQSSDRIDIELKKCDCNEDLLQPSDEIEIELKQCVGNEQLLQPSDEIEIELKQCDGNDQLLQPSDESKIELKQCDGNEQLPQPSATEKNFSTSRRGKLIIFNPKAFSLTNIHILTQITFFSTKYK